MSEYKILMPRIGTNDDYVTIGSWYVHSGSKVEKGQEIASLETTKETVELTAGCEGYLFYRYSEFDEVKVGSELAVISDDPGYQFEVKKAEDRSNGIHMTKRARRFVEEHDIDISSLDHTTIIKESDVRSLSRTAFVVDRSRSNDVMIAAGGGLAKMCMEILRLDHAYHIYGILDDGIPEGTKIMGVPVLGGIERLTGLYREGCRLSVNAIGSIGSDNESDHFFLRKNVYDRIKAAGFFLPPLIHPSACIASSAQLGEGTIVMEHAVVGPDARVGDDVIINTGSIVSHDCTICDHARISPGAMLAGEVKIGENALVGMGVTVYIGVRIGKNAVISNGQHIFHDVADGAVIK